MICEAKLDAVFCETSSFAKPFVHVAQLTFVNKDNCKKHSEHVT
jgi:hypothetical protein